MNRPRLRYTLVSDGPTDANLVPIINWTLKQMGGVEVADGSRAEFWRLPQNPRSLEERIDKAIELYPCDVLFIHRDGETESRSARLNEINKALERKIPFSQFAQQLLSHIGRQKLQILIRVRHRKRPRPILLVPS